MLRFYRIRINKISIGTAIEFREPPLQGMVIRKVSDAVATSGDYAVFVMKCSNAEHSANLTFPDVHELSEAEAIKLAAQYQPKHSFSLPDPETNEPKKTKVPAFDLKQVIKAHTTVQKKDEHAE